MSIAGRESGRQVEGVYFPVKRKGGDEKLEHYNIVKIGKGWTNRDTIVRPQACSGNINETFVMVNGNK